MRRLHTGPLASDLSPVDRVRARLAAEAEATRFQFAYYDRRMAECEDDPEHQEVLRAMRDEDAASLREVEAEIAAIDALCNCPIFAW